MSNRGLAIALLCGCSQSSKILFNALTPFVNIVCVVIEEPPSRAELILRRAKKLGVLKAFGQVAFVLFNRLMLKIMKNKIKRCVLAYGLNDADINHEKRIHVQSVNEQTVIDVLKKHNLDAVIVNGTRILSPRLLFSMDVPFINVHMGITPKYRGVHGAYWALVNKDYANCGVTVHLVDPGIDTGGVLYQDTVSVSSDDDINTYPIHQIAKAIPLLQKALECIEKKQLNIVDGIFPSKLWYHPTLLEYIKNYIYLSVR